MDATVKSDDNSVVRNEAFLEVQVKSLTARVKTLEYECADLTVQRDELSERVKKLASRQPAWPKGYRPQRRQNSPRVNRPN
jgi:hypothetical protein